MKMIRNLIARMEIEEWNSIEIWNLKKDWIGYSLEELKRIG